MFIVLSNFLFIPLVVYTRSYLANSSYSLSEGEWEGIEFCEDLVRGDPNVGFFALTERGKDYLIYTGNQEVLAHKQIENRTNTLTEFLLYCNTKFEVEKVYLVILNKSDSTYFNSLETDLKDFIKNSPIEFSNEDFLLIGPIT